MSVRAIALAVIAVASAVACGGADAPSPTSVPTTAAAATSGAPAATATPGPAGTPGAGTTWRVTSASQATVSVREQLVGFSLPSDAVLVATGAKGVFGLRDDGTFTSDSKISFDLTTLTSDSPQRDGFVKRSVLQTSQFPTAEFVPAKATGLALPLASGGDLTFTLAGMMTIHGVAKDVTFQVKATRTPGQLTARATAEPSFTFAQFGMSPPSVPARVVSVVDAIRLVVDLVATSNG